MLADEESGITDEVRQECEIPPRAEWDTGNSEIGT